MTKDEIKAMALECGFTLREHDGSMDLNPYVYDFANRLIAAEREECINLATSYAAQHYMGVSVWPLVDILRARSDK